MKYNTCLCKGKESVIPLEEYDTIYEVNVSLDRLSLHDAYVGKFQTSFGIWRERYKKRTKQRKTDKKTQACALHPGPALISNNP